MHDDNDIPRDAWPAQALRDLPLLAPPRSAWPQLRAALDAGPRRRVARWPWLALAAALALALVLPRPHDEAPAPDMRVDRAVVDAAPAVRGDALQLQALMAESIQLEALLAWSRAEAVESAAAASLGAAIQDRIGEVDALLARTGPEADALLPLWQERVLRLRQLAGLESTQHLLAANGDADDGMPVLAF